MSKWLHTDGVSKCPDHECNISSTCVVFVVVEKTKLGMSLIRNPQCVLLILHMLKELRESTNPCADMVTERTLAKLNQLSSLLVSNVPLYFNKEELASVCLIRLAFCVHVSAYLAFPHTWRAYTGSDHFWFNIF